MSEIGRGLTSRFRRFRQHLGRFKRLCKGRYQAVPNPHGLSPTQGLPLTLFTVSGHDLIHNADFLPDRFSFAGRPIRECPHFDFAKRCLDDSEFDYRETEYFRLARQGRLSYPSDEEAAADQICRQFIYLINCLKRDGYQPEKYSPVSLLRCVDQRVCVIDGKHRVATLLAMGMDEFPVVFGFANEIRAFVEPCIIRSHPVRFYRKSLDLLDAYGCSLPAKATETVPLKERIRESKLETWAEIYHPIPFHEFSDLTTQVDGITPYRRLSMILNNSTDLDGKKVLDLGCNLGFYSFSLAKRGARTMGIDVRQEYIDIATELAQIYEVPASFACGAVSPEWILQQPGRYDLAISFSMIQWVIDQKGMEYGMSVLRAISEKADMLFFDVAVNSGKACLRCAPGHELAFSYDLLRDSTGYEEVAYLGEVSPYGADVRHVFLCRH